MLFGSHQTMRTAEFFTYLQTGDSCWNRNVQKWMKNVSYPFNGVSSFICWVNHDFFVLGDGGDVLSRDLIKNFRVSSHSQPLIKIPRKITSLSDVLQALFRSAHVIKLSRYLMRCIRSFLSPCLIYAEPLFLFPSSSSFRKTKNNGKSLGCRKQTLEPIINLIFNRNRSPLRPISTLRFNNNYIIVLYLPSSELLSSLRG